MSDQSERIKDLEEAIHGTGGWADRNRKLTAELHTAALRIAELEVKVSMLKVGNKAC